MDIITKLREEFLNEAVNSPTLLADLSSMETYIAESYQNRSIIELLQNADDAQSSKLKIVYKNNMVFVANDGRNFDSNDVLSICRSGSSTKKRGDGNIGYRGIGFKSVVNFAEIVHVISRDLSFTFSKELTQSLLNDKKIENLPLIRIPHQFSPKVDSNNIIEELFNEGYNVVFLFENIKSNQLLGEIERFDSSSLIFLRKINNVIFQTNKTYEMIINRENLGTSENVSLEDEGKLENWLVIRDSKNFRNPHSIAFMLNEERTIIPLDSTRSVVHSFMPTQDLVGLPFKINSDFSTDPSRTKVVFDEKTMLYIESCVKILIEVIQDFIYEKKVAYKGILDLFDSPFSNHYTQFKISKDFREYFIQELQSQLKKVHILSKDGTANINEKIKIQPSWLNEIDFLKIATLEKFRPLSIKDELQVEGIINFAKIIGIEELEVGDLNLTSLSNNISEMGKLQITNEYIRRNRFNLTSEKIELFKKSGMINLRGNLIDQDYFQDLTELSNDVNDVRWFFKQFNLEVPLGVMEINKKQEEATENSFIVNSENKTINYSPSIQKWRSVEKNLQAYFEIQKEVTEVRDVSKSNLGYDLEVHRGSHIEYIEVKSVEKMGASFSLTNNEYSTAHELREKFTMAIVKQTEKDMEICFINNPIQTLNLIKRVTRWEWMCDEYSGKIQTYKY